MGANIPSEDHRTLSRPQLLCCVHWSTTESRAKTVAMGNEYVVVSYKTIRIEIFYEQVMEVSFQ